MKRGFLCESQSAPQRLDRRVHAMLEIDERIGGPQPSLQLFSCEQLAGLFQKQRQNLKRPPGQANLPPVFAQLAGV